MLPTLVEGSTILDANGETDRPTGGCRERKVVPLGQISRELQQTVLAVEDADFYRHDGG